MKKSVAKEIKNLAAKLPTKLEPRRHTERFTSQEVTEARKKYRPGEKLPRLNPNKTYTSTTTEYVEINHYGKMKNLYNQQGMEAVQKYFNENKNK